ncbi:MAG: hypothetical protein WCX16_02155, partial [Candidatus Omnitrophota bacterium]
GKEVEEVEVLAGDMLAIFLGDDGQVYMCGTETGDFMRTDDIPKSYRETYADRYYASSKTNMDNDANKRATIGNMCRRESVLRLTRVNAYQTANNFEDPQGPSMQEASTIRNLLMQQYIEGLRGEKGTSGDQPNLWASILKSDDATRERITRLYGKKLEGYLKSVGNAIPGKEFLMEKYGATLSTYMEALKAKVEGRGKGIRKIEYELEGVLNEMLGGESKDTLLSKYGKDLDRLLGWDITVDQETGKAKDAIMQFNDKPGEVEAAIRMAEEIFTGITFEYHPAKNSSKKEEQEKHETRTITGVNYDPIKNHFSVVLSATGQENVTIPLERNRIFNEIFTPLASTFAGNSFVSPEGMNPLFEALAATMEKAGVLGGTVFTQLKVPGMEEDGPGLAAEAISRHHITDERDNARYKEHMGIIVPALISKYGEIAKGQIPDAIKKWNLFAWEIRGVESVGMVHFITGEPINVDTPYHHFDPNKKGKPYEASLLTPQMERVFNEICGNESYTEMSFDSFTPNLSKYTGITADNRAELIYQILIKNGQATLNSELDHMFRIHEEVIKAAKIAEMMEENGFQYYKGATEV